MNVIGCDLSSWQKGLSMQAVKEAGMAFAILRGGYTGTGTDRSKNKDVCFETFYNESRLVGLPVGAYWYSCAKTWSEGEEEARYLSEHCLKGKQFEYPIYIDIECDKWQGNDKRGVTDAAIAFCDTMERLGFFAGIYASLSWFKNKLDLSRLEPYSKWVAAWQADKPILEGGYAMWQQSSTGHVGRYSIDVNVCYSDYPEIIKKAGLNGYGEPVKTDAERIEELEKLLSEIQDRMKKIAELAKG